MAKEGFPDQVGTAGQKVNWVSKYGSVTFNLAGREFAWGGMNEAGLVVGTLQLLKSKLPERDERPGLSSPIWVQYLLDTCGTVEEAVKVDATVRIEDKAAPVHFLIADAKGNCASLEWFDGKFECHTGESLPLKAQANMSYARAVAAYNRGGPHWWWSNPGKSAERVAAAHNRSISYDANKEPDAITYAFGTLVNAVVAPNTKWSIVYDIGKKEIWYGTVISQPVKHLSFKNLDFSCEKPLMMLDVNTPMEGDIEKSFIPYNSETNQKVFLTFCGRYGLNVSQDDAIGVTQHIESFKCTE